MLGLLLLWYLTAFVSLCSGCLRSNVLDCCQLLCPFYLRTTSHVSSESELKTLQLLLHCQSVSSYLAMQHKCKLCFLTMTLSSAVIFTDPSLSVDVHCMIIYFASSHKCLIRDCYHVPGTCKLCSLAFNTLQTYLSSIVFVMVWFILVHFCAAKHFKFPYQTVIKVGKQVLCFSVFILCNWGSVSLLVPV